MVGDYETKFYMVYFTYCTHLYKWNKDYNYYHYIYYILYLLYFLPHHWTNQRLQIHQRRPRVTRREAHTVHCLRCGTPHQVTPARDLAAHETKDLYRTMLRLPGRARALLPPAAGDTHPTIKTTGAGLRGSANPNRIPLLVMVLRAPLGLMYM